MEVNRYNFFLDEALKRRNRYIIADLEAKGHNTWLISMAALFPRRVPALSGAV
jgi:hypothetical protein